MPETKLAIGIDLGTSTSEIALYEFGKPRVIDDPGSKSPIVPSLVARNRKGDVLVGEDARNIVDQPGVGVREVKRLMGTEQTVMLKDKSFTPQEISAMILKKLVNNAEVLLGQKITDAVISVPANFPDAARQATKDAAAIAGLNVLALINEPTAAALAFGVKHIDTDALMAVFDWGGGTLDVTIMEMIDQTLDVQSSYGDPQLGGKDFDDVMISILTESICKDYPQFTVDATSSRVLKEEAERAKRALTDNASVDCYKANIAVINGEPVDLDTTVTRAAFELRCQPLLDRARVCVEKALTAAKVASHKIQKVILVGGTTYMPCVRKLVSDVFGMTPSVDVNPDLAVALGAAVRAAQVDNPIEGVVFTDKAPYGLGINVVYEVDDDRMLRMYEPLINAQTSLPYMVKREYSLMRPDQTSVEVALYQSYANDVLPLDVAVAQKAVIPCDITGKITDIPPSQYGTPHPLEILFSYDRDGIIELKATIPGLNRTMNIAVNSTKTRLSDEQIGSLRQELDTLMGTLTEEAVFSEIPADDHDLIDINAWQAHPRAAELEPFMDRAETLVSQQVGNSRDLQRCLVDLKMALADGNSQQIEKCEEALIDAINAAQ